MVIIIIIFPQVDHWAPHHPPHHQDQPDHQVDRQVEDEDKYQPVSDDPMSNLILEAIKNDDLRKMERAKK